MDKLPLNTTGYHNAAKCVVLDFTPKSRLTITRATKQSSPTSFCQIASCCTGLEREKIQKIQKAKQENFQTETNDKTVVIVIVVSVSIAVVSIITIETVRLHLRRTPTTNESD